MFRLSRSLAAAALLVWFASLGSTQAVKLGWAGNLSGFYGFKVYQILPIPGGGFLAAVSDDYNHLQIARVNDNDSLDWIVSEPGVTTYGCMKILPDNNVYFVGGGSESYIGKYNLTTGAKVGSFSDPNGTLAADLGPDLTAYFIQIAAGAWTAAPAGSPDTQQLPITYTLLRVSNTLVTTTNTISTTYYGHGGMSTYYNNADYCRILFYKSQVFAAIGARYNHGLSGYVTPYYAAWSLDGSGVQLWNSSAYLDTSSISGTNNFFPYALGFDAGGNFTAAFQKADSKTDTSGPILGVTLNGLTGAPQTYSGTAGLADHQYATGGFYYREYTDFPRSLTQQNLTPPSGAYAWNNSPIATLTKRNNADTSTIWTQSGQGIARLPFQIVDVTYDPHVAANQFSVNAARDTDLAGATTVVSPGPGVSITAAAQQQDTGIMLIGGTGGNGRNFFAHLISQPVLNSYTYAVPKNQAFTSPNSIFFADRFTAGLSPQIGAYVKHGTLILHTDGTFVYTPTTGFTGTDFFIYRVQRPGLPTVSAEIGLNVS